MLSVTMTGSGYDRGREHAYMCKNQIFNAYKEFCYFDNLPMITRQKCIYSYLEKLAADFPDLINEMQGIATETNLELEQVAELTLWEELKAYSLNLETLGKCTSIAFTRTPKGPILGKTTDIEVYQRPYYVFQSIQPKQGYKLLSMGKVGSIKTEVGINEKGLCVATGSTLPLDTGDLGIERMTLVRIVLQYCSDVDEAIAMISKYNLIRLGLYFLLVDQTCRACVIEKSISHQEIRFPDKRGIIFATNFYVIPKMAYFMDKKAFYYQNALERYVNLIGLLETIPPDTDVSDMKEILRNHNPIGPICAHFDELGMCSYYAYILVPRERKFLVADGYPCEVEFYEFQI